MTDERANVNLTRQIKAARARLTNRAADLDAAKELAQQIHAELSPARGIPSIITNIKVTYNEYMELYEKTSDLAIENDQEEVFPLLADRTQYAKVRSDYFFLLQVQDEFTPSRENPATQLSNGSTLNESRLGLSKLPKISLKTFHGSFKEWPQFRDLYESLILNEPRLSSIEKFQYLVGALASDAAATISAITVKGDNFEQAWNAIKEKYDNKRLLAGYYLDTVAKFTPNNSVPTLKSLRHFLKTVPESIAAFKNLKLPNEADFILFHQTLRCLDKETRDRFESEYIDEEFPTYDSLIKFIKQRCTVLSLSSTSELTGNSSTSNKAQNKRQNSVLSTTQADRANSSPGSSQSSTLKCPCCKEAHTLSRCTSFKSLEVKKRREKAKEWRVCFNCLSPKHSIKRCTSKFKCQVCKSRHHTYLHLTDSQNPNKHESSASSSHVEKKEPAKLEAVVTNTTGSSLVLLGTATIQIQDAFGKRQNLRAVIDTGSQFSIITNRCARRLGLYIAPCKQRIMGAGLTPLPKLKGKTSCNLSSRFDASVNLPVKPIVLKEITTPLPTRSLDISKLENLDFSLYSDERFWQSRPVDFLIGNDIFLEILSNNKPIKSQNNFFNTIATVFGLVVMGPVTDYVEEPTHRCLLSTSSPSLDKTMRSFWELEEAESIMYTHPDDKACEEHFKETHSRTADGRYIVRLPFKQKQITLGPSMPQALSRLQHLESKLRKNTVLQNTYHDFLKEYIELGHMSPTVEESKFIIPHHAVFKTSEVPPKLRVVFDASMRTPRGSLNEKLYAGPKLQQNIVDIILNFRRFSVAVTADMIKMYRQILIHPDDCCWQHIIWRFSTEQPPNTYQLNTVTYGMVCAPYLALRVIKQLIEDEGNSFPLASKALQQGLYVDDIVYGASSPEEALALQHQLTSLLNKGGFSLHKWQSNSPQLVSSFTAQEAKPVAFEDNSNLFTKILGMVWYPQPDIFSYKINLESNIATKRIILSSIAKLYDPMGFVNPVVMRAKIILQKLWKLKLDWDKSLPTQLSEEWHTYYNSLPLLETLRIPRFILSNDPTTLQLFGFCDSSEVGYGAVLYLRKCGSNQPPQTFLLKAKSKLAPLKRLTIPRLELNGAWLLVKLIVSIKSFISEVNIQEIYCFTDSTIVLSWLRLPADRLKIYVANRVGYILEHTKQHQWAHVPSLSNPADILSRGALPQNLIHNELWWHGPAWLTSQPLTFPSQVVPYEENPPETRAAVNLVLISADTYRWTEDLANRVSKYTRLIRAAAYAIRFANFILTPHTKRSGSFSVDELNEAFSICIKNAQRLELTSEFNFDTNTPCSGRLKSLNAFIDKEGLLRVGGRLAQSTYNIDIKHPIILTTTMRITQLIVDHYHEVNFHLNPKALLSLLRRKFWIFNVTPLIRARIFKCTRCYRFQARQWHPLMGELPPSRSAQGRPFIQIGIDFAGPFQLKTSSKRNASVSKAYVCVFVCMSTKCVHLEVVSGLSTELFLRTLDRFIARRGMPTDIFSDNGTNFVGAQRQLKDLFRWFTSKDTQACMTNYCALKEIRWHFSPPLSPAFGGLWEAAVKSFKYHLKRVAGGHHLTFEELNTLVCRIEAILNSRPLCLLPQNSDDGDFLTPGHFLTGGPLLAFPERDLTNLTVNRLSRWQLIQCATQHFWKLWHTDYLHLLQQRPKWTKQDYSVAVNDLVLLRDTGSTPLQWQTGRVIELHPGKDGVVRVVTLKTASGTFKRSLAKLIPFPSPDSSPARTSCTK